MNLCKKWELNPWICWWCELKQTTGLKFSSESVTKGVNLTYPIVWAWESNPEPTQVWNRKPIQGVQRGLEPMTMLQGWLKQYKCSNLEIEPMTHVLWDKILVKKNIFLIIFFLYLGDGFCPLWGCYYCLLWSCSLFSWAP